MTTGNNGFTRRALLRGAVRGLVAINVAGLGLRSAHASPALTEDDPTGKALGYHEDVASIDKAKFPAYKDGQNCANCVQYKGADGEPNGACAIFPGKTVTANGWCKVWVTK